MLCISLSLGRLPTEVIDQSQTSVSSVPDVESDEVGKREASNSESQSQIKMFYFGMNNLL